MGFESVSTYWLLTREELLFKRVISTHRGLDSVQCTHPRVSQAGDRRGEARAREQFKCPACGIVERAVSVWQSGGTERLGNCRSAARTQRKLAPRRKVGARALSAGGAGQTADLQAKEYIPVAIYFCRLSRPFRWWWRQWPCVCPPPHALLAFSACTRCVTWEGYWTCFHTAFLSYRTIS